MLNLMVNMGNGSSAQSSSFEFTTQAGVMAILQSVRAAEHLQKNERQELRDMIFTFANTRGDMTLRTQLEARLQALGITPLAHQQKKSTTNTVVPATPFGFAGARPQPQFHAQTTVKEIPAPSKKTNPNLSAQRDIPPSVAVKIPVTTTAPATTTPTQKPKIVPTVPESNQTNTQPADFVESAPEYYNQVRNEDRVVLPTTQVTNAHSVPVQAKVDSSQAQLVSERNNTAQQISSSANAKNPSTPQSVSASLTSQSNSTSSPYLQRIQEIKTDINTRVGNPVNLVDINNEVGREYMSALLESMKQLSAGNNPDAAMQKLERAYTSALQVLEPKSPEQPIVTPPPSSFEPAAQTTIGIPVHAPEETLVSPKATARSSAQPTNINVPPAPSVTPIDTVEINNQPSHRVVITPPVTPDTETVQIMSSQFNVPAVSEAAPLRPIEDVPSADQVHTDDGVDPLYSKEVDSGLEQLLHEWPIFQKSGLFNRGSNGKEHPLFMTIASLPIPLILTGRFEGSTQAIIQSISDYLNGWRYEQGLVYEEQESFEHYLRRVVKHILDWQKKSKKA